MNGEFAPGDEELENDPGLEERLCDYCIGEDLIYLSLAYSVADRAYELVRCAAYFAGVGFFSPSDGDSAPVFFGSHCTMLLEGEWFRPVSVSEYDSIVKVLMFLFWLYCRCPYITKDFVSLFLNTVGASTGYYPAPFFIACNPIFADDSHAVVDQRFLIIPFK